MEFVRKFICAILDAFIAGEVLTDITKRFKGNTKKSVNANKTSMYECNYCNFETKFATSLKAHKTKLHSQLKSVQRFKCKICAFEAKASLDLGLHMKEFHEPSKKRTNEGISQSSSPPHKKHISSFDGKIDADDVEMVEVTQTSQEDLKLLSAKVKLLEERILILENAKKMIKSTCKEKETQVEDFISKENSVETFVVPPHLSKVKEEHIPSLRGYKLIYETIPDGSCLDSAFAVHVYEDPNEVVKLKKMLIRHVIENWDNHYCEFFSFPFKETVGVGKHAKEVCIANKEEMMVFLNSDDALMVYSDNEHIQAYANMFNINIHVFTYDASSQYWTIINPDAMMAEKSALKSTNWIPDIALYHSKNNHFDLLVKEDSRLALIGPIDVEISQKPDVFVKASACDLAADKNEIAMEVVVDQIDFESELPSSLFACSKCSKSFKAQNELEVHVKIHEYVESEIVLDKSGPYDCIKCDKSFESKTEYDAHVKIHDSYSCRSCDETFLTANNLDKHMKEKHKSTNESDWNCNDCAFQASDASCLLTHLKRSGHQPSENVEKKKLYPDYRQCYTCNMEFDGYITLMNHRKTTHPSKKKCKNFPGNCRFNNDCWYIHEEESMEIVGPNQESNFKCNFCDEAFTERGQFMMHNKTKHLKSVAICKEFTDGKCQKGEYCWFRHEHRNEITPQKQVFQQAQLVQVPPDHLGQLVTLMNTLCIKMEEVQERLLKM